MTQDERRRPFSLNTEDPRQSRSEPAVILGEAHPIGRDVSGIPDRQCQPVRGAPEGVADLKRGGLLSLQAKGIDRVYECDGPLGGQRADHLQRLVKGTLDLDDFSGMGNRSAQLPGGDFASRYEDDASQSGAGGVGGGAGRRVPRAGADHRLRPVVDRLTDGGRHASILERPAWIECFIFDVKSRSPQLGRLSRQRDQRCIPLKQGDRLDPLGQPHPWAIVFDDPRPGVHCEEPRPPSGGPGISHRGRESRDREMCDTWRAEPCDSSPMESRPITMTEYALPGPRACLDR